MNLAARDEVNLIAELIIVLAATPLQANPDSLLHVGTSVRVKAPSVAAGWLEGTVARSSTSSTCLAVRLERRDAAGRPLYVFLRAITAVKAPMASDSGGTPVEKFTISIEPRDARHGTLTMAWGTFRWTAPIVVQ